MNPVLLLGLDGATYTILDPLIAAGDMPNLGALFERGTRGTLRSIMPPLTPPAWTSLMTGKHPGQHGVFDFFQKEEPGSIYFTYSSSQDVRSQTIWTIASDQGKRVISLNYPLMFPAPAVEGAVVPGGMMPWRQLRLGCHPPGLFQRLKELPGFNPREMLDMEMEVKAIDGCPEEEYADWIDLHINREQRWGEVLRYLMSTEPAELTSIMFDGVDKLQHLCWRFIDPAFRPADPTDWERDMIERCRNYYRSLDGLIGEALAAIGPDATVVVASDHGFGPTQDIFHVNTWLEQQGYLYWADPEEAEARRSAEGVGFAEMTRHVNAVDWSRTLAYAATPSSQGIHIVEKVPGTEDPLPEDVRARLSVELAGGLMELRHPVTGAPLIGDLWTREQAFVGPFEGLGPDLSMVLAEGGTMSILPSAEVITHRPQVRGHHRWEGIYAVAGPGVRPGDGPELSLVDIAPVVLHRLGLAVPDDMAGALNPALFTDEENAAHPVRTTEGVPVAALAPSMSVELKPEEQAAVMERLRALGYVE